MMDEGECLAPLSRLGRGGGHEGYPFRSATICATMLTAISSGV